MRMIEIPKRIKHLAHYQTVKYYLQNPVTLAKNRIIVLALWLRKITKRDINFDDSVSSDVPIEVVIPAIDKDYEVLRYVIRSIKKNIRHPIRNIFIVSPKSQIIAGLCDEEGCVSIDENTVLPITKKDINYNVRGLDRSGWIFQQFLKLGSDKFVNTDYFLIADADTVFCRPQVFVNDGKVIFSVNSQFSHVPYLMLYQKLFGRKATPLINFTSHHSLVKKSVLSDLKKELESRFHVDWYKAILNNLDMDEQSSSSDYDDYGNFFISIYKDKYLLEHWFNLSLRRDKIKDITALLKKWAPLYKTISFHSYKK